MLFILFNVALFIAGLALTFSGFVNFPLILTLPVGLKILIGIGFVTPIMTLYDTIRNFFSLITILGSKESED